MNKAAGGALSLSMQRAGEIRWKPGEADGLQRSSHIEGWGKKLIEAIFHINCMKSIQSICEMRTCKATGPGARVSHCTIPFPSLRVSRNGLSSSFISPSDSLPSLSLPISSPLYSAALLLTFCFCSFPSPLFPLLSLNAPAVILASQGGHREMLLYMLPSTQVAAPTESMCVCV